MKKMLLILLLILSFVAFWGSCIPTVRDDRPINEVFKAVASQPPYGVSIINIDTKAYIVVRVNGGFGDAISMCPK